jgi:serine/threonine protein kinase
MLVQGVRVLHENFLIHRDLKPDNLLLHQDKNLRYTIKISDYGLSRAITTDDFAKTQCGTPFHMACAIFFF